MESIRLTTTLFGAPEEIYEAWISSKGHAAMTGSAATSEKRKGGSYTAWDGYISGKHLELDPGKRILQTWRTKEFPEGAPDSRLELKLLAASHGTKLTLLQSGIPDGQGEMYAEGWHDHYFEPMNRYFAEAANTVREKKVTSAKAQKAPKARKATKAKKKTAKVTKAVTRKARKGTSRATAAKSGAARSKKKATRGRARAR